MPRILNPEMKLQYAVLYLWGMVAPFVWKVVGSNPALATT